MKKIRITILMLSLIFCMGILNAAENDAPNMQAIQKNLKKEYFSLGGLFQYVYDWQSESTRGNGFSIANTRLKVSGALDKGFGYLLQMNLMNSPALLDAKMYYAVSSHLVFDMGVFKAPFSREYLTSAGDIDFVNRSRAASLLPPKRQIGLQAHGDISLGAPISYAVGMFNGNGYGGNFNDNNSLMSVIRINAVPIRSDAANLQIGLNAATSRDDGLSLSQELNPLRSSSLHFAGDRTLYGADMRLTSGRLLLAAEFIAARLDGSFGEDFGGIVNDERRPNGYYFTIGYNAADNIQLLARLDRLSSDKDAEQPDWLIFGVNLLPTAGVGLQANYVLVLESGDVLNHQFLFNAQIAF